MNNKIEALYNIFIEYNINLSMFIKVAEKDNETLGIIMYMAESEIIDNESDKYIIANGINIVNMYREEYGDIVHSREQELNKDKVAKEHPTVDDVRNWIYCDYTDEQIKEMAMDRLEKIILTKIYFAISKDNENIDKIKIVDINNCIIFSGKINDVE